MGDRNPVQYRRILDPEKAPSVRRLFCRFYDDCLEEASEKKWNGFSCKSCHGYETLSGESKKLEQIRLGKTLKSLPSLRLHPELGIISGSAESPSDMACTSARSASFVDDLEEANDFVIRAGDADLDEMGLEPPKLVIEEVQQVSELTEDAPDDFVITAAGVVAVERAAEPELSTSEEDDDDDDFVITVKGVVRADQTEATVQAAATDDDDYVIR